MAFEMASIRLTIVEGMVLWARGMRRVRESKSQHHGEHREMAHGPSNAIDLSCLLDHLSLIHI